VLAYVNEYHSSAEVVTFAKVFSEHQSFIFSQTLFFERSSITPHPILPPQGGKGPTAADMMQPKRFVDTYVKACAG
jgi:hypothetical protein